MKEKQSSKKKISTKNEFHLHYIGKGMYNPDVFSREAQRHGVQRAVSFSQLKSLKFGEPILLASFIKDSAEVFGYFTLNGISHNLPKELSQLLSSKLTIIKTQDSPFSVSRACGSYSVGSITYIKEDLSALIEKIEETFTVHKPKLIEVTPLMEVCNCKKCGINIKDSEHEVYECIKNKCPCCTSVNYTEINSFKWFINGTFYPLTSFILTPAKFARGIIKVTVDNLDLKKQSKTQSALVWLYNYRQRHYLQKKMRDKLQDTSDPWKDVK